MERETKIRIFQSAKTELMRHSWDTFVETAVSRGRRQRRRDPRMPGLPQAHQYKRSLRHLSDDVLPVILRKAFEIAGVSTSK